MAKPAMAARGNATPSIAALLRCPACRSRLVGTDAGLHCAANSCGKRFPVVAGVPILIHEANSLFRVVSIAAAARSASVERSLWDRLLPRLTANVVSEANYQRLAGLLAEGGSPARVLVVGAGRRGVGIRPLFTTRGLELVETDVMLASGIQYVCDGHDLPFADEMFDAVVLQAVLEHVIDPGRVVAEVNRVLKRGGLVYAETPFMQQVHAAELDFTRFTDLGHRRLFREFSEIGRGAVAGPGSALAWSFQHFLLAFSGTKTSRKVLTAIARMSAFWLKYFDRWLLNRPAALDAASSLYFLGRKQFEMLDDRSLTAQYRGAQGR